MIVGFDIISDLHLTNQDTFEWTGKPTSLFCIVPGNISSDMSVLYKTLALLSTCYKGVFFIDGTLENPDIHFNHERVKVISKLCETLQNVVYLHTNVVVVEGIALVGINGWEEKEVINSTIDLFEANVNRYDDILYLEKTIERLQIHPDVRKIVVISNCIPAKELYYDDVVHTELFPTNVMHLDTEFKVTKWVYGTSDKMTDTVIDGVRFLNNPKHDKEPYYPKRIDVEV